MTQERQSVVADAEAASVVSTLKQKERRVLVLQGEKPEKAVGGVRKHECVDVRCVPVFNVS